MMMMMMVINNPEPLVPISCFLLFHDWLTTRVIVCSALSSRVQTFTAPFLLHNTSPRLPVLPQDTCRPTVMRWRVTPDVHLWDDVCLRDVITRRLLMSRPPYRLRHVRVFCFATLTDRNSSQASHEQNARRHGDDIRRVLAAAEPATDGARVQRRRQMALLPADVSYHARDRHELHHLQSVPLRLDERQLQERIPAGTSAWSNFIQRSIFHMLSATLLATVIFLLTTSQV